MNKQHLQALLDRVTDGAICDGGVILTEDCALIYACFPDDVDGYGMFETASVTEVISLIMDGSTDAAVAFAQATLPGWAWLLRATNEEDFLCNRCGNDCGGFASVWRDVSPKDVGRGIRIYAHTPSRALLMSALTALIAVAK